MDTHSHEDRYDGPAALVIGDRAFPVEATLRGYFEPLDGRYHWYGRLSESAELSALAGSGLGNVEIRTDQASAFGRLHDIDTWGRYRISGLSTPPFHAATAIASTVPSGAA